MPPMNYWNFFICTIFRFSQVNIFLKCIFKQYIVPKTDTCLSMTWNRQNPLPNIEKSIFVSFVSFSVFYKLTVFNRW